MAVGALATEPERGSAEPIARKLAKFAYAFQYEDIPEVVRERAKLLILDAVGIAYASTHYDFASKILAGLQEVSEGGISSVIGCAAKLPLRDAVIMNGALVHGLDYDDTHMTSVVHPTASSFTTALGMTERLDLDGKALLSTYVLAMENVIRVGMAANGGLHKFGFHPTGVCGHFSTALAVGRLLGLDVDQLSIAQGFAGSTAAASMEFVEEGGWNKRIHGGWAGAAGITAAYMAKNGFVGPTNTYEGRFGLYKAHLHGDEKYVDYDALTRGLGEVWETAVTAVKPFPTCHFTHAIADSALAVHHNHGVGPDDIERIRVQMPEIAVNLIAEPLAKKLKPVSDYDAKFSVQFMVAACFYKGKFGLAELEEDMLQDPGVLNLAAKVDYEIDSKTGYPDYYSGGILVTTKDGNEYVHHERVNRGAGDRALSASEIEAKYIDNAILVMKRDKAEVIRDAVLNLDEMKVSDFAKILMAQ
ncbi:MmgE/PrpD family protein [Alphaproteobacteria bacterium]|jgi:2-methylcitrate dehydratase PrpD|nr:MmgE/PrpD family protein [Alphaproteobacteria bacterium]